MKTKEKKKTNKTLVLKPASKDIYYEYICTKCGCNHWVSHKEVSNRNFRIICDCEIVIKPKRIIDIEIIYAKKNRQKKVNRLDKDVSRNVVEESFEPLELLELDDLELEAPIINESMEVVDKKSESENIEDIAAEEEEEEEEGGVCIEKEKVKQQALEILNTYGYSNKEAISIIDNCDEKIEVKKLVKEALTRIGKQHEYFYNQTYEIF
jgi:hypothetical protein